MTNRGRVSVRRVCVLQRHGESNSSPIDLYLLSETQIEPTDVKLCFENIIERPPLKAGLGDVAQENWVNSLLNLLYLHVFMLCFL